MTGWRVANQRPRAVQVAIGCGARSTGSGISPITEGDGITSA